MPPPSCTTTAQSGGLRAGEGRQHRCERARRGGELRRVGPAGRSTHARTHARTHTNTHTHTHTERERERKREKTRSPRQQKEMTGRQELRQPATTKRLRGRNAATQAGTQTATDEKKNATRTKNRRTHSLSQTFRRRDLSSRNEGSCVYVCVCVCE